MAHSQGAHVSDHTAPAERRTVGTGDFLEGCGPASLSHMRGLQMHASISGFTWVWGIQT